MDQSLPDGNGKTGIEQIRAYESIFLIIIKI